MVVFGFRQSATIEASIESAFAQACEPIEIILSDDASPDDTYEKMQRQSALYSGPHRVHARRNSHNLGIEGHFNEVVAAAQGELIVMMAGDDLSLPDRVARIAEAWDVTGQRADLIASHLYDMSPDGQDLGVIKVDDLSLWRSIDDWARRRPYVIGAAHAFTKRLFTRYGPLQKTVCYEDQINLLRAICDGGACTIDAPLVRYRRGGVSDRQREFSAQIFLGRLRRLNAIHLAVHRQWLHDAEIAGCQPLVKTATATEFERELYLESLLNAPGAMARLGVMGRPSSLPVGWRWRKGLYLMWPSLAARIRWLQSASKRMRSSDKR